MNTYAGIGARTTPPVVLEFMKFVGTMMAMEEWTLRSGGADGADVAFEAGCDRVDKREREEITLPGQADPINLIPPTPKEIFLPWKGFNGNSSPLYVIPPEAYDIAYKYHPNSSWLRGTDKIKHLLARNSQQVLGKNLDDPVDFVLCWTPDGIEDGRKTTKSTGGTGQALRIATDHNIPIINLHGIRSKDDWNGNVCAEYIDRVVHMVNRSQLIGF